jgi:hypothetical protein
MSEMNIKLNDNNQLAYAEFGAASGLPAMRVGRHQEINSGPDSVGTSIRKALGSGDVILMTGSASGMALALWFDHFSTRRVQK